MSLCLKGFTTKRKEKMITHMLCNCLTFPCANLRLELFARDDAFWFQEQRREVDEVTIYNVRDAFTLTSDREDRSTHGVKVRCGTLFSVLLVAVLLTQQSEPRVLLLLVYLLARMVYCEFDRDVPELGRFVWFTHSLAVPLGASILASPVFGEGPPSLWIMRVLTTFVALFSSFGTRALLLWPHVVWPMLWAAIECFIATTVFHSNVILCFLDGVVVLIVYGSLNSLHMHWEVENWTTVFDKRLPEAEPEPEPAEQKNEEPPV